MTTITPEIRQAIEQAGNAPIRIEDPETKTIYVLVKEEELDQLRSSQDDPNEMTPEELSLLMWDVMKEDWNDPSMDVYDSEEYA
jgi:hypothetical protein